MFDMTRGPNLIVMTQFMFVIYFNGGNNNGQKTIIYEGGFVRREKSFVRNMCRENIKFSFLMEIFLKFILSLSFQSMTNFFVKNKNINLIQKEKF